MCPINAAASGASSSINEIARAIARASPARTPSWSNSLGGKQLPRDDEPLNLARSLADGRELHVAEIFLRRIVLDEAVAAMNLDAVLSGAHRDFARIQLRHRRLERGALAGILHCGGAIRHQPRGLDPHRVVHQLGADALKRSDQLSELFALERIRSRGVIGTLCEPYGERGDADAAGIQHLEGVDEPLSFRAKQLTGGDAAI